MKEILKTQLRPRIDSFKQDYAGLLDEKPTFFVDYVNILSPLNLPGGEEKWGHGDNNTRFIMIAKEAMAQVQRDLAKDPNYQDVNIVCTHTNSAINKNAKHSREFNEDKAVIEQKIAAVTRLTNHIAYIASKPAPTTENPTSVKRTLTSEQELSKTRALENIARVLDNTSTHNITQQSIKDQVNRVTAAIETGTLLADKDSSVRHDIATRIRAAYQLRLLTNNHPPFKDLPLHQRNLMKSALEVLVQGKQAIKLLGCKSARDRTAILMAAIKTMQENKEAMSNWKVLNNGIIHGLKQGQHFRAMLYHVAAVKISDVHKDFMKQLPKSVQSGIKAFKKFSKTLEIGITKRIKQWFKSSEKNVKPKTQKTPKPKKLATSTIPLTLSPTPVILDDKYKEQFSRLENLIKNDSFWRDQCGRFGMPTGISAMKKFLESPTTPENYQDDEIGRIQALARICNTRLEHSNDRKEATRDMYNIITQSGRMTTEALELAINAFEDRYASKSTELQVGTISEAAIESVQQRPRAGFK